MTFPLTDTDHADTDLACELRWAKRAIQVRDWLLDVRESQQDRLRADLAAAEAELARLQPPWADPWVEAVGALVVNYARQHGVSREGNR